VTHTLRPYQRTAIDRVRQAWLRGDLAGGLVLPTGTGKTFTAICLLREEMLAAGDGRLVTGRRALWLAHRDELLEQPREALAVHFPEAEVGIVKAARRRWSADVVVASVQSLHAGRLAEVPDFEYVVVDEAHHAVLDLKKPVDGQAGEDGLVGDPLTGVRSPWFVAGNTYGRLLVHLRRKNPRLKVVGLTATPFRGDRKGLGGCFPQNFGPDGLPADGVRHGVCYFAYGLVDAVQEGHLSPFWKDEHGNFAAIRVDTGANLDRVHTRAGDFVQAELAKAVNTEARNRMVVEAWLERAKGRPTLAFCVDVGDTALRTGHVFTLCDAFRAAGVRAEPVWGAMDRDSRRDVLRRFKDGELDVVTNCGVLTEGFDAPVTSCIVMARPTKSRGLYCQMVGRGTRLFPGKVDLLVIDCADATPKGEPLQTLADLTVDRPIDPETGAPQDEPEEEAAEPFDKDDAPRDVHGRIDWRAVPVLLWGADKGIAWGRIGTSYILGLGDRRVVAVYEEGPAWRAVVADTLERSVEWLTNPFGASDSEEGAVAAAEGMVRRTGVHGRYLVQHARDSWATRQPVSDRQMFWMTRFGFRAADLRFPAWNRSRASVVTDWCLAAQIVAEQARGHRLDARELVGFADVYHARIAGRRAA